MNYVVRRGPGLREQDRDELEALLSADCARAAHQLVLDEPAPDVTVYVTGQEHDAIFRPANSFSALIEAENQPDLLMASHLFFVMPAIQDGEWLIAWRTSLTTGTFTGAESLEEVQSEFRLFLGVAGVTDRSAKRQESRYRSASKIRPQSRFVLFLGSLDPDAAASRLKASGVEYIRKRLVSKRENWSVIASLLSDENLVCAVGRVNKKAFDNLGSAAYADVAHELLDALTRVPHLLLAHESVLTGEPPPPVVDDDFDFREYMGRVDHFINPTEAARVAVRALLEEHGISLVPYRTNAEFSVLSDSFVADNERDLLFRVYVPAGRLYAAEADKLLSLFRDWLGKVDSQGVRQGGYETPSGLGSGLGRVLLADVAVAITVATLAIQTAATRLAFSMARDGALPFSTRMGQVSRRTRTPVLPAVVVGALALAILVVNIGQAQLFAVITSVGRGGGLPGLSPRDRAVVGAALPGLARSPAR